MEAMRCTTCGSVNPGHHAYCGMCGNPLARIERPEADEPRVYTPQHLERGILSSRSGLQGERKQVTVLFVDIRDSLELAQQFGPEPWHFLLDRFFRILTAGIHRFQGNINQYTGDGVMALFGAPAAREDHALRGCRAALHLRDEISRFAADVRRNHDVAFDVRMGLNSGEVVVGPIGDGLRMDYTAQGRVVGEAERVEALSESGAILLAPATAALVSDFFRLEEFGSFELKGITRPVTVYRLEGAEPAHSRMAAARTRGFTRFVGRVEEMASLLAAMDEALAGHAGVLGVSGDAGVGKSRLCHEFGERCRAGGVEVRELQGVPHAAAATLLPVAAFFRREIGLSEEAGGEDVSRCVEAALAPLGPELAVEAGLLGELLGVAPADPTTLPVDPNDRLRALFELLVRLLRSRPEAGPTVYLIDDLQWFDETSERFLDHLADAVKGTRTLIVANFRTGASPRFSDRSEYRELRLTALSDAELLSLLRELMGPELASSDLGALIRERTSGNPFFVEEIVASLAERGALEGPPTERRLRAPMETIAIPARVQAVVAERIDRLSEVDKSVVQAAAVLGRQFARSLLDAVSEAAQEDVSSSLDRLIDGGFLAAVDDAPERFRFRHPLTQEVAYGALLGDRRGQLHAAAARAVESAEPTGALENASLIAHHWDRARNTERAVEWHKRAARWAAPRDPAAALRTWQRIRELLDAEAPGRDTARLGLRARAEILSLGASRTGLSEDTAGRLLHEGRELAGECGDRRGLARLLEGYGAARGFAGDLTGLLQYIDEAARVANEIDDRSLRINLQSRMVFAHVHVGNLREALLLTDELLAQLPADPELRRAMAAFEAAPSAIKGMILGATGHMKQGADLLARAAELAGSAPDHLPVKPIVLLFSTMLAWFRGDGEAASRAAEELSAHAARSRSTWDEVLARLCEGQAALLCNRPAVAQLEAGLETARQNRIGLEGEADLLAFLAEAHLDAGDPWRGLAAASEASRVARQRGTRWWEIRGLRVEARARLMKDGVAAAPEARSALERALVLVDETGAIAEEPFLRQQLASLSRICGERSAAEREIRTAATRFGELDAPLRAAAVRRSAALA